STDCVCRLHTRAIRDVSNKCRNLGESSVSSLPRSQRRVCADSEPVTTVSAQPSRLPGSVEAMGGADLVAGLPLRPAGLVDHEGLDRVLVRAQVRIVLVVVLRLSGDETGEGEAAQQVLQRHESVHLLLVAPD